MKNIMKMLIVSGLFILSMINFPACSKTEAEESAHIPCIPGIQALSFQRAGRRGAEQIRESDRFLPGRTSGSGLASNKAQTPLEDKDIVAGRTTVGKGNVFQLKRRKTVGLCSFSFGCAIRKLFP